jgi:hypothetical protein
VAVWEDTFGEESTWFFGEILFVLAIGEASWQIVRRTIAFVIKVNKFKSLLPLVPLCSDVASVIPRALDLVIYNAKTADVIGGNGCDTSPELCSYTSVTPIYAF